MERIKQPDHIKIRISGLSSGLHEYHFSPSAAELGLGSNFGKLVEVDVAIDKTPRQVLLKSNIRTSGIFNCDRCIENFERPISTAFTMLYIFDEKERSGAPDEEVQVIAPDTVYIDISEDVRQMITLSVPLKLLCREDCRGLCPRCGKNRNIEQCDCRDDQIDPRWQGLEGLITN